ncbi:hypothetical protein RHSIM_Rhsim03G0129500 [Rhododendron simsii]|uniref:Uncharacterized protein n=1 Tax=Rhododendron simsii TaxID=118357 RepID=A0A834LUL9_RHOSS|nr:hypothetical protein RHSIM_Rhsim03G0129500 [Rhododendron simsii]
MMVSTLTFGRINGSPPSLTSLWCLKSLQIARVAYDLDDAKGKWNISLLKHVSNDEFKAITSIPILINRDPDKLVWHSAPMETIVSRVVSVSHLYAVQKSEGETKVILKPNMQEHLEGYMKNGYIPQNQELLGRVFSKNILASKENLFSRRCVASSACPV